MAEKAKFQFNGQTYNSKGRLCHDIVKYYVEQNPNASLAVLQKAFNIGTRMIVVTPEMALTVVNSDGKAGGDYYIKEADQITIKDGKVVVWSYWPESYFKPFMEQVRALGIEVVEQGVKQEAGVDIEESVAESHPVDTPKLTHEEVTDEAEKKMEPNELALQLDDLIEAALADGVLTEKEKQVLFKKAQSMGMDLNEFEMVLESRLFKKKNNNILQSTLDNVIEEIDPRKVISLVNKYKRQYDGILIKKDDRDYVPVERKAKDGRTIVTNQYRWVKVVVTDEYETSKARDAFFSSLNPETKEDMLATVEFLAQFVAITKFTEKHFSFNTIIQKCGSIMSSAKQLYSSDSVFMGKLSRASRPFQDVISVVDKAILSLNELIDYKNSEIKRMRVVGKVLLFIQFVLLCLPWLLLLKMSWKYFWVPILIDVILIVIRLRVISSLLDDSDIKKVKSDAYRWLEEMKKASKLLHDIDFPKEG